MRFLVTIVILVGCANNSDPGNGMGSGSGSGDGNGSGSSTVDELRFAIVGDTRPASPDDTANYPTDIITKIYQDVEAESPHPQFVVSTGDYIFATTTKNQQQPQLDKYMAARAAFTGPLYPAMGNHECTGATDSNCGAGNKDGTTPNMTDFIQTMLAPINISQPYYTEHVSAADGSWTAKFVFVACNAWTTAQGTWLAQELSVPTTYTFVVRHEGTAAVSQTPCQASQSIITSHPLTLLVVGHTHTYAHYASDREIVVGNGGAPLTTGMNYGYAVIARNASGTLTITVHDYMTHAVLDTFSIQPTGAAA